MLNSTQLEVFRTAILAEPNLAQARANGDLGAIAAYYNVAGSGTIWRPNINVSELNTAIVWSEFAAVSVQLQNTYIAMLVADYIDTTSANIRGGFATVFGAGTASRANLLALAQRVPTRFEMLFTLSQVCSLYGYQVTVLDVTMALEGSLL